MLYPTLNQPIIFISIFAVGFVSGLLFDFAHILSFLSRNDKFSQGLFDFLAVVFSFGNLFYTNLFVNYGQFRFYIVLSFLGAMLLERFLSKILWTKWIKRCYNKIKENRDERRKKEKDY